MGKRYVVLEFDDGERFDYEPPLPHPADMFLEMFPTSEQLNGYVGATCAFEIDQAPAASKDDKRGVLYPPKTPWP